MNRVTKTERIAGHTVHYISDNDIFEITGCPGKITGFPILRLSAYEDAGLEPEEIIALCDMDRRAKIADMLRLEESAGISTDRLRELAQAEKTGQLVVLSEPMKPMVYKPNDTDVYCPPCGETLSGGWPLSDADDPRKLCQCPNCGQSIDDTKCEAAEAALEREIDK